MKFFGRILLPLFALLLGTGSLFAQVEIDYGRPAKYFVGVI